MPAKNVIADRATCEYCHEAFQYDEGRRCWQCDMFICPLCAQAAPQPVCPECRDEHSHERAAVKPMLAVPGDLPRDPSRWAFEYKWDGVRALCHWNGRRIILQARNLNHITGRYPDLALPSASLSTQPLVLDGEIVALGHDGRPSFGRLQQRMLASPAKAREVAVRIPVHYFVFDILALGFTSLLDKPYQERRRILDRLQINHPRFRITPSYPGEGETLLANARLWKLEGIVAKRLDGRYQPGIRSANWRKIKIVTEQEFVIGGWLPRARESREVRSLVVGYYEGGELRYAGNVGSGFSAGDHQRLATLLADLQREANPFADPIPDRGLRFVAPKLVATVRYRRWPADGKIQHASFLGLRTDVSPEEVIRERKD